MTEAINVQVSAFLADNFPSPRLNFQHKGINFHVEISADETPQLSLLNSRSIQVFIFSTGLTGYGLAEQKLAYLKHNNINSKILIIEDTHGSRPELQNILTINKLNGYYMNVNTNDPIDFQARQKIKNFENEKIRDKLLEMSLENNDVIESAVISDTFSVFLNTGKVEKNVLRNFCAQKRLQLPYCLKILKESNQVFEHSGKYYFIHNKSIQFIRNLQQTYYKSHKNGLLTYENLERIFEEDVDIAVNFLQSKNILIKNEDKYGYTYSIEFLYENRFYEQNALNLFNDYTSQTLKNISLKIFLNNELNHTLFAKKISENSHISAVGKNFIFLDDNIFIIFNINEINILFFQNYDLDILNIIFENLSVKYFNINLSDGYTVRTSQIKTSKNFVFQRVRQEYSDELKEVAKKVYPFVKNL